MSNLILQQRQQIFPILVFSVSFFASRVLLKRKKQGRRARAAAAGFSRSG
jgi:hypothetical protein